MKAFENMKRIVKSSSYEWTILSSDVDEIKTDIYNYILGMPKHIALEKYTYSYIQSLLHTKEIFSLNIGKQINYIIIPNRLYI